MAWQNADGLYVRFGPDYRQTFVNRARALNTLGEIKQAVIDYDLTKIPAGTTSFSSDLTNDGTVDGFNGGDFVLPASCVIEKVIVVPSVSAAGGTSITVGTYRLDGTTVSANSLVTATEGVTANLAIGTKTLGAGALTATTAGTSGVGTHDVFVGITTAGTFTAGKGKIVITYIDPLADSAANI